MHRVALLALAGVVLAAVSASGQARPTKQSLVDCACYDIVRVTKQRHPTTVFKNTGENLYGVSRDRRHIVYGASNHLYVARIDGSRRRLIDRRRSHWAVFAPNSKQLAYAVDRCRVCIASVAGGRHRFRVRRSRGPVVWSPDSRQLAFVVSRSGPRVDKGILTVAKLNGTAVRSLRKARYFYGRTSVGVKMAWSPRGGRLAYLAGSPTRIHVVRVRDRRQLAVVKGRAPVWSPNGRRLVFSTGYRLAVMDFDGSRMHRLDALSVDPYGSGASWSPSGHWIAYARYSRQERYQLAVGSLDGRKHRLVATENHNVEIGPTYWSKDGKAILYTTFLQQGE